MKKLRQRLINEIYTIALDKRQRVLLEDEVEWFDDKMRHIRRLCRKLKAQKCKINKRGEIISVKENK